ncbi:MAG: hypothetical protein OXC30_05390 [Alphaproteobacteria bacterium]|nr:hypothetical protein [Alphaproteobacteria bacterium]
MHVLKLFVCVMVLSHQSLWCVDGQQDLLDPQVMSIKRNSYAAMTDLRNAVGDRLYSLTQEVLASNRKICAETQFFEAHTLKLHACLNSMQAKGLISGVSAVQKAQQELYKQEERLLVKQGALDLVCPEGVDFMLAWCGAINQQRTVMIILGRALKHALNLIDSTTSQLEKGVVVLRVSQSELKGEKEQLCDQQEKIMTLHKKISSLAKESLKIWKAIV